MKNSISPKIVVLPSFYPMNFHFTRGGFFEEQTRLIKKNGFDVSVIFNEDRSMKSFSLSKFRHVHFQKQFSKEENLSVYRRLNWNLIPTKFDFGRKIWINSSIHLIESYIKKYGKPDLFHVHCAFNSGCVAKYLKDKYQIPYIVTEHSTFFALSNISDAQKKEVNDIYNKAEKVIVVSKPFRKLLSDKTGFDINKIFAHVKSKYKNNPINTEDGLKIEFENDWVHLRTSNTEPIIRIYSESSFATTAENIARRMMQDISEAL
jgi:hypothetical protein